MKKFLNSLFVLSPEYVLSLENSNVVIKCKENVIGKVPLITLEEIFCFNYFGATPSLMGACAESGIGLSFFSPQGKFLARTVGYERGNVLMRQTQYHIAESEEESCRLGRNFILGKVYNSKWVVERFIRDHPQRIPVEVFKKVSQDLSTKLNDIRSCSSLDILQGLEGKAAQEYFGIFDNLVLQQKEDFSFSERNRRPPLDKVNALLSFTYSILERDCEAALEGAGIDPYMGFIHRIRPGRRSMALDLMEELRSCYADRFVLYCINQRIIQKNDFEVQENGAVMLNEGGRRKFFFEWQKRKLEIITHPFLKEKIPWGLVPYAQALLLARTLRGDLDAYPPFLWK